MEVRLYSFFNLGAMGMGCQRHAPASVLRECPGTHCTGGWVGPRASMDRYGEIQFVATPGVEPRGPSSPWRVATSTTLFRLPLHT